jgi:hypothetical protein
MKTTFNDDRHVATVANDGHLLMRCRGCGVPIVAERGDSRWHRDFFIIEEEPV